MRGEAVGMAATLTGPSARRAVAAAQRRPRKALLCRPRLFFVVLSLLHGNGQRQHETDQAKSRQRNQSYHQDRHGRLPICILSLLEPSGGDRNHQGP